MQEHSDAPIGVFDSGVGGLTVLSAIHQRLPNESLIYVADSGFAPYGDKPAQDIIKRAKSITDFLLSQGAKAIVMACNTATVVAASTLRQYCPVPIVALEPAIKPATQLTTSKVIGVLATRRTLESPSVATLCERFGNGLDIRLQPCPGLVEQVEQGAMDSAETQALLKGYLTPLIDAGADTLVLGCTHYPLLRKQIAAIVGPHVQILDSALAVSKELQRRLTEKGSLSSTTDASVRFFTSGHPDLLQPLLCQLWGKAVSLALLPD
ncbi:glutamate racemase [Aliiglaciecola sp. CAU 1673]|uniref:glutamate racemase n=1 Tax=Aliiglaciecola sp. CAU 1673 TaxID=3032595 RepID=UPI0023DC3C8B|nr:glutamate racemase [Aliiglaciecola sp. CAU 1673]MDF2178846.1 glutamate racemase [Aliiglaciecola sp. CAU 1673]